MRFTIRLALGLAIFLTVAGTVYAVTAREPLGAILILVLAVVCIYIAVSLRSGVQRAEKAEAAGEEEAAEPEVTGTIWPFILSIGALFLVIGALGPRWMLIPAVIVFAGAGAGWFVDIQRQRVHAEGAGSAAQEHHGGE